MGNNNSRFGYLRNRPEGQMLQNDEIGRRNLRTNYYTLFMFFTIVMIIMAVGALGGTIYLIVDIFKVHPRPDEEIDQKAIAFTIAGVLGIFVLILSIYYAWIIGRDLDYADVLVTDLTRLTTAPLSDTSFKANMTNLIANRLGNESEENKQKIFDTLDNNVLIDPINYVNSEQGRKRFGINNQGALDNFNRTMRNGGFGRNNFNDLR